MSRRPPQPETQGTVGPHEVVDRILEVEVVSQVGLPLGMRQRLANQSPVGLAGRQVVSLHIGGVDPRATPVCLHDSDQVALGAEEDLPLDFDHASPFTTLLDLGVTQIRIHHASRLLARAARATSSRGRLRLAVVGDQRRDVRRQLIAGEEGGSPIGSGLESSQKRPRLRLAPIMAEVADHAQPAGQGQGTPDPSVADIGGVLRVAMGLLFLTKVQSSSIWTWVRARSRMIEAPTAAPCFPAKASQCSTRLGEWRVRRAVALRLLRSLKSASASMTVARGLRMVSKKVGLSALKVRRHVLQ
jgi:hypothetical protein